MSALRAYFKVHRCALVADGSNVLSCIPLHGLSEVWSPIHNLEKKYWDYFPGYISSVDGPKMDAHLLDDVCSKIQNCSGIARPFDNRFYGPAEDSNLFARIIRGELEQWRVWEDDQHVAFLTPFGNTPGFTVLVPRAHLSSDIFALDANAFSKLMEAAHTVAGILKSSLGAESCGMIFEDFEIDYAHVKLVPIHHSEKNHHVTMSAVHHEYRGYVTSLSGPLHSDQESLSVTAAGLSKLMPPLQLVRPPKSWISPTNHLSSVLGHQWYKNLFFGTGLSLHYHSTLFQAVFEL